MVPIETTPLPTLIGPMPLDTLDELICLRGSACDANEKFPSIVFRCLLANAYDIDVRAGKSGLFH